ncbi:MAG: DinB family protein [Terracidiphilus sp.]
MDFQKELIAEYDREAASTRKILAAIPTDADFTYKPHPKSMTLGNLAGHIAETTAGDWAIEILTKEKMEYSADHKYEPYVPASTKALLERFDKQVAETKAVLSKFTPEKWEGQWKFIYSGQTFIDEPKHRAFRTWVMNHMIHHRAQLGVYLRLLDKPVPGMYGPSADEM